MSDIKDEIDWEFPGANTTEAQSNYFWQGIIRGRYSFCFDVSVVDNMRATQPTRLRVQRMVTSLIPSATSMTTLCAI